MSRGVNTRSVDKLVALGEGRRGEGADMRSKDMQAMQRSVLSQGSRGPGPQPTWRHILRPGYRVGV